jgi:hypothetical protein
MKSTPIITWCSLLTAVSVARDLAGSSSIAIEKPSSLDTKKRFRH